MKKIIRLTESDLHNIIKESVQKILREETEADLEAARKRLDAARKGRDTKELAAAATEYKRIKALLGKGEEKILKNPSAYWSGEENKKRGITPSDGNAKWKLPGHLNRQKEANKEYFEKTNQGNNVDDILGNG